MIPFTTPDGHKGLMDEKTRDYLRSTAPQPTQAALTTLLGRIARVRVVTPMEHDLLSEVQDPDAITEFRRVLAIDETRAMGHCMCIGDPHLELFEPGASAPAATIGVHHGFAIRWDVWKDDAHLADGMALLRWLAAHGAPQALQQAEEDERRANEEQRAWESWRAACPASLRPMLDEMLGAEDGPNGWAVFGGAGAAVDKPPPAWFARAEVALTAEIPETTSRVLALFGWFGQGGRWSGYSPYELLPQEFLSRVPTESLIAALLARPLTPAQLSGAARHFCCVRSPDCHLPDSLRETFLRRALATGDEDRVTRASAALLSGVVDARLRGALQADVLRFRTAQTKVHTPAVATSTDRLREIAARLDHAGLWPDDVFGELPLALRRLWACDCAERALPFYEQVYAGDLRLRRAIEAARRYVRGEADVLELEQAWCDARSACNGTVTGMRASEAAGDDVWRRREGRACSAGSAAMSASDVPRSYPTDFAHAAHTAEDAVVGFDLRLDAKVGKDGERVMAFPNYKGKPDDPARLAERSWQRRRLAELILESLRR